MWSETRLVRKDATIRLFGGAYETDPALAGRKIECVFDPFDLTVLEIRWNGTPHGIAVPRKVGRDFPSQGETRGSGHPGARDRDRLPRHHQGRARGSRPPAPDPLRHPRRRRTGPGRAGGREVTAAVPAAEISAVLAWAARLTAAPAGTHRDCRLPHRQGQRVHDAARGLPRAVNNIATQALIAAMAARKNIVDEQSARTAVNEITAD